MAISEDEQEVLSSDPDVATAVLVSQDDRSFLSLYQCAVKKLEVQWPSPLLGQKPSRFLTCAYRCQRKASCEGTVLTPSGGGSDIGAFQQSGGGSLYFQGKHPGQQELSLILAAPWWPAKS